MASFASSATTCGARKHAWTNIENTVPSHKKNKNRHTGLLVWTFRPVVCLLFTYMATYCYGQIFFENNVPLWHCIFLKSSLSLDVFL